MILLTGGRGASSLGGASSRGVLPPGGGPGGDPPRDGYCCGRYVSYWNAFLLIQDFPHRRCRHVVWGSSYFLPPSTVVAERECFYRCLSVHRGACVAGGCGMGVCMMVGVSMAGETATGFLDVYKTLGKMGVSVPSLRHHPQTTPSPPPPHTHIGKFRSACSLCNKPYYYCHEKRSSKCSVSNKKWAQSYSKNSPANPRAFSPLFLYCRRFWEPEIEFEIFCRDWGTDIVNS